MYPIDISEAARNNDEVFEEMLEWLRENVGPETNKHREQSTEVEGRFHRKFRIEGTGWFYEYHVIRVPSTDTKPITNSKFKQIEKRGFDSTLYMSKRFYIEDSIRAVEFKLKW
jgi:hypothetical protein